jgi:hypothetical protein
MGRQLEGALSGELRRSRRVETRRVPTSEQLQTRVRAIRNQWTKLPTVLQRRLYACKRAASAILGDMMGSSGSGRISDYPGTSQASGDASQGDGGGQQPPEDRCARAFSVRLEDIEHSDYYQVNGAPPLAGEALEIRQAKRLVAVAANGLSVGNLPTGLNYLAACMKDGWRYAGRVTDSGNGPPTATVSADFAATSPP